MAQPTPLRAIRLKCLDCSNNQPLEVKNCTITDCPLYCYRLGKNPKRKGMGNPEAFKKYRESQAKKSLGVESLGVEVGNHSGKKKQAVL
jgi:hypothetical protein